MRCFLNKVIRFTCKLRHAHQFASNVACGMTACILCISHMLTKFQLDRYDGVLLIFAFLPYNVYVISEQILCAF